MVKNITTIFILIIGVILLSVFSGLFTIIQPGAEVGIFTWESPDGKDVRWVYATPFLGFQEKSNHQVNNWFKAEANTPLRACTQQTRTTANINTPDDYMLLVLENVNLKDDVTVILQGNHTISGASLDGGRGIATVGIVDLKIEPTGVVSSGSNTPLLETPVGEALGTFNDQEFFISATSDGEEITFLSSEGTNTVSLESFENPRLYFLASVNVNGARDMMSCTELSSVVFPQSATNFLIKPTSEVSAITAVGNIEDAFTTWDSIIDGDVSTAPNRVLISLEKDITQVEFASFEFKKSFGDRTFIVFNKPLIEMFSTSQGGNVRSDAFLEMTFGNVPIFSRMQEGDVKVLQGKEFAGNSIDDISRFPTGTIVIEQDLQQGTFRFTKDGGSTWSNFFPSGDQVVTIKGFVDASQTTGSVEFKVENVIGVVSAVPLVDASVRGQLENGLQSATSSITNTGFLESLSLFVKNDPVIAGMIGLLIVLLLFRLRRGLG